MKVLIVADKYFYYALAVSEALKSYGHDVEIAYTQPFRRDELSVAEYLKYKINKNKYKLDFRNKQIDIIKNKLKNKLDVFINISANFYYEFVDRNMLMDVRARGVRTIAWFMGSIKRYQNVKQHFECYDKIFSFEPDDAQYMLNEYSINIEYLPVGVYEKIFSSSVTASDVKKYDICFVGNPTEKRLKYLEAIAEYCCLKRKKMIVYGYYWDHTNLVRKYFAKRSFAKKYPYLARYVPNEIILNENMAKLYDESKICLNIHIEIHKGINPRTFEIMANGNFELCDARFNSESMGLVDKENIAFYDSVEDCVEKIDYYLAHQQDCARIGKNGMDLVKQKYGMKQIAQRLVQ